MEWIVGIVLKVLTDMFYKKAALAFKNASIKRGITITAEKNVKHIQNGNQHLDNGNLQGWLTELNNEES